MNLSDLISQAEASRLAEVSRARVSQWINEGKLTTYNVGGRPLVSKSQLSRLKRQPRGRPSKKAKV
ncbi:MAG TPA: hypothetical protein VGB07_23525 [Blastocatellia bacterium]